MKMNLLDGRGGLAICACIVLCIIASSSALNNGLGSTPQMGFNTWNHFHCNISDALIRDTVDAMIATGLTAVGYKYINLDDCWQISRDNATGKIIEDPAVFPNGIQSLIDYVHSKGLLFGLYSDAGYKTCAGRPGSLGYEKIDAQTYADWGVDYLKYDNCNTDGSTPETRYPVMRDALNATGHPIFFSMCEWGVDNPATWAPQVGNSWRTTGDISDDWDRFIEILDSNEPLAPYAGPGGWNDPDMLEVGNGGMNTSEYRAHFTLWCLMKAPLLIGCDVRNMTNDTLITLTNTDLIEWNQDALGKQGTRVSHLLHTDVWAVPLVNGKWGVVLFNRDHRSSHVITAYWKEIGLDIGKQYTARDVWLHKNIGLFQNSFSQDVPPRSVVAVTLFPK